MIRIFYVLLLLPVTIGCQASVPRAGTTSSGTGTNAQHAVELTQDAVHLMAEDPQEASRLLRLAIDADFYHGPAHNNLGVLLLRDGELYAAAEEFDLARRLMPGHPDPRINLGIALERGGKTSEALEAYASAIEVYPQHLPSLQALARLQIRTSNEDETTDSMLRIIAARGDAAWSGWARRQLAIDGQ